MNKLYDISKNKYIKIYKYKANYFMTKYNFQIKIKEEIYLYY